LLEEKIIFKSVNLYTYNIPEFIVSMLTHNILVKELVLMGKPGDKLVVVGKFCQRLIN
jgi:hypothetical protein